MSTTGTTWTIVLAAGDGNRLRSLTTDAAGVAVPKQFCSLRGGASLLQETLDRARSISDPDRVVAIVADAHRRWWNPVTAALPRENVIVQPRNRGTGNGILLPLLHVMNRDPDACVVILPSDHYVRREFVLRSHLRRAVCELDRYERELVLLGISPEEADPELGYIEPAAADGAGFHSVGRFVEKPESAIARELLARGGMWNSFIMASRAQALLDIYAARFPEVVTAMVGALQAGGTRDLYEDLPDIDFSRHVITGYENRLRMLAVPPCGWSDLGTPERVARTLTRLPRTGRRPRREILMPAYLDLATARLRTLALA